MIAKRAAKLYYYIFEQKLEGWADGGYLTCHARSGGWGADKHYWAANKRFWAKALQKGSDDKTNTGEFSPAANNPYATGFKTKNTRRNGKLIECIHGGPLPVGSYTILSPKETAEDPRYKPFVQKVHSITNFELDRCAAYLEPDRYTKMGGRSPEFFIHWGSHSDGCIVPVQKIDFEPLMKALNQDNGGILIVYESENWYRFA